MKQFNTFFLITVGSASGFEKGDSYVGCKLFVLKLNIERQEILG